MTSRAYSCAIIAIFDLTWDNNRDLCATFGSDVRRPTAIIACPRFSELSIKDRTASSQRSHKDRISTYTKPQFRINDRKDRNTRGRARGSRYS